MFFFLAFFKSEAQKRLEEIKEFRKKMKEVADEARNKEEIQKQLVGVISWRLEYMKLW